MFEWQKLGRVFDPTQYSDRGWLQEFAQAPSTVVFDDYIRVYFSCRPKPDPDGKYVSYSAWVDLDRSDPLKVVRVASEPVLQLGTRGSFDEFGVYPFSAIRAGGELRAYYGGWTRCQSVPFNVSIGVASSFDGGDTFQRSGEGPVLSYSPHEPFILSGPKIRFFNNRWYLFYIAGRKWKLVNEKPEPIYKIRAAVSDDGYDWEKFNLDLIESRVEEDEAQASPDVFYSNGRYHMFFCYRHSSDYRNHERGYRIGYAYSEDLINWIREDDKAGLELSEEGWDSEMISYPHVFEVDEQVYMAYLGNQFGRFGFGLAKLIGTSNRQ